MERRRDRSWRVVGALLASVLGAACSKGPATRRRRRTPWRQTNARSDGGGDGGDASGGGPYHEAPGLSRAG